MIRRIRMAIESAGFGKSLRLGRKAEQGFKLCLTCMVLWWNEQTSLKGPTIIFITAQ